MVENEKTSYAVEKIVRHENQLKEAYHTVRWYGYELQEGTANLQLTFPTISRRRTGKDNERVTEVISSQKEKEG